MSGLDPNTVRSRIEQGWTAERILTASKEAASGVAPSTSLGENSHQRRLRMLRIALLTTERVSKRELRAMCAPCSEMEFGLALNEARDLVRREYRVEFIGLRRSPDTLVLATGKQVLDKMARFTRASVRKLRRVHDQGQVPSPEDLNDEDRARLQMAQDKAGMRLAQLESIRHMKKTLPMGSSTQPTFPGRPAK